MEYIGIGMEYTERVIGYIGIIGIKIDRLGEGKGLEIFDGHINI